MIHFSHLKERCNFGWGDGALSFEHPKFEIFVQHKVPVTWKVLGTWFWNAEERATSERLDFRSEQCRSMCFQLEVGVP